LNEFAPPRQLKRYAAHTTMKTPRNITALVVATLVLSTPFVRAQSSDQALYNEALRAGLEAMDREWGKLNLTERGTRVPIDFHNPIVRKDTSITQGLNSQFGQYRITYLDDAALLSRWKTLRKPFAILAIRPLDCPDGRLKVTVHLSWINYRRGQLQFEIDSWANVYLRRDTINGKYVVDNVELGGV
jgi:hypothetical protein